MTDSHTEGDSGHGPDRESDPNRDTESDPPDNVLFSVYEQYIGDPESQTEVYLGFGLFFAGVTCALLGLALFVGSVFQYGLREPGYFAIAQPAYVLGLVSPPLALLGVVVLLPVRPRMTVAATGGTVVIAVATVVFVFSYPAQWFEFGPRNTLAVVGMYAAGLSIVTAATGSALVGHRVEQAQTTVREESSVEPNEDSQPTLTEVEADIDDAMGEVELTWGGVEKEDHRRLEFTEDFADDASGSIDVEAERTVDPRGVDEQVEGLRQLKGSEPAAETSGSGVDDQAAALTELRQQQNDSSDEEEPEQRPLTRLINRLFD